MQKALIRDEYKELLDEIERCNTVQERLKGNVRNFLIRQGIHHVREIDYRTRELYESELRRTKTFSKKTKYIFVKKEDPSRPFQYSMLQHRVMQMIRKNDIRDENGELLNFGTHTFRHCYGKKLTEMHIDDWMIARLLGHKTLQSVHHYRKIGNKIMADETRAVREKIDMILMDVVKEWDGYEI